MRYMCAISSKKSEELFSNPTGKRRKTLFPTPVIISERYICSRCGGNRFYDGKCVNCGRKIK